MTEMNIERMKALYQISGADVESARYSLALTYERKVKELRSVTEHVMSKLQRNLDSLDKRGRADNELGVLQGSGMELDRLCGEVALAQKALETFDRTIHHMKEVE